MKTTKGMRRYGALELLAALILGFTALAARAESLPTPSGPVVLTVAGAVERANRGPADPFEDPFFAYHDLEFDQAVAFDLAMLEALETTTMTVANPNWPAPATFEGPLLRDLLDAVGARGTNLWVLALDGYSANVPVADAYDRPVMFALKRNGRYMGLGGRGPAWLVYPTEANAEPDAHLDMNWVWAAFFMRVE